MLPLHRGWQEKMRKNPRNLKWFVLWTALLALLILTLLLVAWLLELYGNTQEQRRTDAVAAETSEWANRALILNLQDVQQVASALNGNEWADSALRVLRSTKFLSRIERRSTSFELFDAVDAPGSTPLFGYTPRYRAQKEAAQACAKALEPGLPVFSATYFVPTGSGVGLEVLDVCMAEQANGNPRGFTIATIGLTSLLESAAPAGMPRTFEVIFLQSDDTRIARAGFSRASDGIPTGAPKFYAERVLAVPGLAFRLRVTSMLGPPPVQFNTVTVVASLLCLLLMTVLFLLLREFMKRAAADAVIRHQQERLQSAARLATVGEIASLISHEINQPLHSIAMYADAAAHIAQAHPNMPTEMLELLERISGQAVRGGRVVRGVRDFVTQSRGQVVRETVSAGALINGILPLIELQAKDIGATVVVESGPPTLKVVCDRLMVEQLLLNLARNAIQAMGSSLATKVRELRMSAHRTDDGSVRFEIRDTGPGIAPDVLERLSQPLYKPFESTKGDGMGLGISMCRSVAEAHLGVLEFSNIRGPGPDDPIVGARFAFTLPGKVSSEKRGRSFDGDTVPQLT